jgi:hypothetical protein
LKSGTFTLFSVHLDHFGKHNETFENTTTALNPELYVEASKMPSPLSFIQRLTHKRNTYKSVNSSAPLAKNPKTPGFFFWSVVVNPKEESIIIWDSGTGNVQCRFTNNLEVNWEILNIHQADCISVAADKGHVYMTDYDEGPAHTRLWMKAVEVLTDATKYFIVADSVLDL